MTRKDNLLLSLLRCADSATETTISNTLKVINSIDIEELDNWEIDNEDGNVLFYLTDNRYIGMITIDNNNLCALYRKANIPDINDYNFKGKVKFSPQSFKSILQLINYLTK